MNEVNVELPVKINGIVITSELWQEIAAMQTGSFAPDPLKGYNDVELKEHENIVLRLNEFITRQWLKENAEEKEVFELLSKISSYKSLVSSFKLTDDMIKSAFNKTMSPDHCKQ